MGHDAEERRLPRQRAPHDREQDEEQRERVGDVPGCLVRQDVERRTWSAARREQLIPLVTGDRGVRLARVDLPPEPVLCTLVKPVIPPVSTASNRRRHRIVLIVRTRIAPLLGSFSPPTEGGADGSGCLRLSLGR